MNARIALRWIALAYLGALLVAPLGMVVWNTFSNGLAAPISAVLQPAAQSALGLTLLIGVIAVSANTVFGVYCAVQLVRGNLPRAVSIVINSVVDMPFVISDVIVGLALLTLYARGSSLGDWLIGHGWPIVFAPAGMVLATAFISMPFVVREVVPVLRERGIEQELVASTLGASTLQIWWRVTFPSIRRAIAYGVVLTSARALGEFGAVSIVSGRLAGRTETLTIFVDERFQSLDLTGAYAGAVLLALLALGVLTAMRQISKSPLEQAA